MTTLVVLQPGYLPWLGFFDQLDRSDIFLVYDDVQFDKHGWRNRNRIKTPKGPLWLSVPVRHGGRFGQKTCEVEIDNSQQWARKHVASIRQNYSKAPFVEKYLPELEECLNRDWTLLVDLDLEILRLFCGWLGLERRVHRSSQLSLDGERSERLLKYCQHFGADRYLSGDSAQDYLDAGLFKEGGIAVTWQNYTHPSYAQQHGAFLAYMSTLDLVLNEGPNSLGIIRRGRLQGGANNENWEAR